jgi:aspartyl-tRNA(Asn)/glutamyl-tRNA(Gln) amidotransferase subunit A
LTTPHTIADAATALRTGRLTSLALVEAALSAIESHNAATNAFILIDAEGARAAARRADEEHHAGMDGKPLHGLPISLKDLIDVAGQPTTAASKVLEHDIASTDAPVVTRLRAAGAVLIGKTNLHEFALGTTSEDSAYGAVRHPRDGAHVAGGSSGGSAVAVAMGMSLASIGTDTGGSIRIPASACGVVGLKPSLLDVPKDGVIPLSLTLDHVGPLTRTVADARTMWEVLADRQPRPSPPAPASSLRLAVLGGPFTTRVEPAVRAAFEHALGRLSAHGVRLSEVSLGSASTIPDTYVKIVLPEGAAWHARYLEERAALYSPLVRSRLEAGRAISAVDYLLARQARRDLRRAVDALLEYADAIILPTLPVLAPRLGQDDVTIDGEQVPVRTAMLRNTQPFNITGHPAISLPLDAGGWPCGFQLVGRLGDTPTLLAVAEACENMICV